MAAIYQHFARTTSHNPPEPKSFEKKSEINRTSGREGLPAVQDAIQGLQPKKVGALYRYPVPCLVSARV
jgi:hypothetical protein